MTNLIKRHIIKKMKVYFKKTNSEAVMPTKAVDGDAGYDLYACDSAILSPLQRKIVPTGLVIEIPKGYYVRVAPRSGLAIKKGIDVLAGVVDSGYRGELNVVLINLTAPETRNTTASSAYDGLFGIPNSFSIKRGDRIAQLIIEKCYDVEWEEVSETSKSERGIGGFGSSGS